MTDQRDKAITEPAEGVDEAASRQASAPLSRRALLGGASAALPAILTLNSNAAFGWAVTSGTIGTRGASPTVTGEDVICVRGQPVQGGKTGVYAVNESDFYRVPGNYYYSTGAGASGTPLSAEQACVSTAEVHYSTTGSAPATKKADGLGGAVASISHPGAMASLTSNGVFIDEWI